MKGTLRAHGFAHAGADGSFACEIVLDPVSIDTKTKKRDDHLRSADFSDVANFPTIVFTVTDIGPAISGDVLVTGNLVVRGRTTPLTFLAKLDRTGDSANLVAEVVVTREFLGIKKANLVKSWVSVIAHFDRT